MPSSRCSRILVVENHEDTLIYLKAHLEGHGHEVIGAMDSAAAAEILRTGKVDILLCDIGLPGQSGWELLNRVGDNRPSFCVAMSGYGAQSDIDRSSAAGFDCHLTKPFLPQELDAVLRRA